MRKNYLCILLFTLFLNAVHGQIALKGMYIDSFDQILGNSSKEDSLLHYAQDSSYNYLALYSLHHFNLGNPTTASMMASFIYRARVVYGITYVGAVGEDYNGFLTRISPYNLGRSDDNERFNVFNLEFEFWTQSSVNPGGYYCTQYLQQANCSCDTSGGFQFFISQMHRIDSLAATQGVLSETYLGWFNQGQAQQITQNADRILLHAYRTGTSSLFSYSAQRLQYLASLNTTVKVAPIFSAEPVFMGPWLNSNPEQEAYNTYKNDFDNSGYAWTQYIDLLGYQWFDWGYMPKPTPGSFNPVITTSGSPNICAGSSLTLTATAGDSYQWSTGATTRSITTSVSGSYSCYVTSGGNSNTTPVVTVNVVNNPVVTISQGNTTPSQVTLNSAATAGSGSIAGYQWKLSNSNISGATASTYDAVASGNYSLAVTNNYGCSTTSNVESVTVTAPACIASVPSGLSSSAATEVSQLLSWAPGQTGDSIIVRYHPDASPSYSYVRMLNTGQTSTVVSNLDPNTLYSWRVKTVCGNVEGAYSNKSYFTTGNTNTGLHEIPHVKDGSQDTGDPSVGFAVYPNPATDQLNVEFDSAMPGEGDMSLTDMKGQLIQSYKINMKAGHNHSSYKLSGVSTGIYFLTIRSYDKVFFQKIVVGH
jgi:hypothetical protein